MNIDWQELNLMAQEIDPKDSESLAKLLTDILQKEYAARHKKRSNLIKIFSDIIDEEQGGI